MYLLQPRKDFATFCQIKRRDDLFLFEPLIDPKLVTYVVPLHDKEFLVKLFFELALPLKSQIDWADDQDPFG